MADRSWASSFGRHRSTVELIRQYPRGVLLTKGTFQWAGKGIKADGTDQQAEETGCADTVSVRLWMTIRWKSSPKKGREEASGAVKRFVCT
jgi:hypothetical protein